MFSTCVPASGCAPAERHRKTVTFVRVRCMNTLAMALLEVVHVSVSIDRPPQEVYRFVSTMENLPRWASGLSSTIREVDGEWVADSPMGKVRVRFAKQNDLGVLDHDVTLESGETVHNPMRVVPNGTGSEVTFTLMRRPGVSDEEFARDRGAVEKDLRTLETLLAPPPSSTNGV